MILEVILLDAKYEKGCIKLTGAIVRLNLVKKKYYADLGYKKIVLNKVTSGAVDSMNQPFIV